MKEKEMLRLSMEEMRKDLSICMILLKDKSVKGSKGLGETIMYQVRDRIQTVIDGMKNPIDYY